MRRQHLAWISWVIVAFCLAATAVSLTLFSQSDVPIGNTMTLELAFLAFPTVGAMVVSRRQTNTVGWLFCLVGVGTATTSFSAGYVKIALLHHADAQPGTAIIDLIGNLVWVINITLFVLLLYLFPDGHPLSRRWRLIVWALLFTLTCVVTIQTFTPGPLEANGRVPNPLGIQALPDFASTTVNAAQALLPLFALLALASLVIRYRRAEAAERQQIKWFVFGASLMLILTIGGSAAAAMISSDPNNLVAGTVGNVTFALGILALPVGVGIGVLRYRLYDIDILINRTLVYGSLTAILAALYFGLVIGAQLLTRQLTGQQAAQQPLVIVLSTLLIAALVQPLRRRLQRAIDRRFYRSRYDATRTLAAFNATLRQEVELASLREHLLGVVEETMRPSHTFLWLSQPTPPGAPTHSED